MDNLSALWETFSLTESEGSKYNVYDGGFDGSFLLAARFFSGSLRETDKQFGPWLRANTSNLAKKTVVRVAGYEEEVNADNGAAPSPEWGNGGDMDELNNIQNNGGSDHHQSNEDVGRVDDFDGFHAQIAHQWL
nr:hypothetical protein CFP56_49380 [Quercus suber]